MPPAKRRAVQNYAKALNTAGVPFDVASILIARWLKLHGLDITEELMEGVFSVFDV